MPNSSVAGNIYEPIRPLWAGPSGNLETIENSIGYLVDWSSIHFTPLAIMSPPSNLAISPNAKNAAEAANYQKYISDPEAFVEEALDEWTSLARIYQQNGIYVFIIPPRKGLIDQTYTADPAVILQRRDGGLTAIVGRFFARGRQGEIAEMERHLRLMGVDDIQRIRNGFFEGAGDVREDLFRSRRLWIGFGPRSSREGAEEFAARVRQLGFHPILLELVKQEKESDQASFHLDTCFLPLPQGEILCHMEAFTNESQDTIHQEGGKRIVPITAEEAESFATNVKAIRRDTLVIPTATSPRIGGLLESFRYNLIPAKVDTLMCAAGGVSCTSNTLYRLPQTMEDSASHAILNIVWLEKLQRHFELHHPGRILYGNPDLETAMSYIAPDQSSRLAAYAEKKLLELRSYKARYPRHAVRPTVAF